MPETTGHDPQQMGSDGQHQPDVDVESLIGEEVEPDHDLDLSTFAEEPDDGFGDDEPADEITDDYVDFNDNEEDDR